MYRVHDIKVRKENQNRVNNILWRYYANGDLDDLEISSMEQRDDDGNPVIVLKIRPYLYEDFERIKRDFELAGIQIM